ncbi:hypothetical protein [Thiolapillus sp.]
MSRLSTNKTILATALAGALAPLCIAEPLILTVPEAQDMQSVEQISVQLFASENALTPMAREIFFPGEWRLLHAPGRTRLQVDFQELDATERPLRLWAETMFDGQVGQRQAILLAAATPGVTFASGNDLNMDGNNITQLADPAASQDAATKAYVDAQVGGVPGGDITAVIAGTGLNGGAASGDATLNLNVPLVLSHASSNSIIEVTNTGMGYGVEAFGNTAGGYFMDGDSSGFAYVGFGDSGIEAYGSSSGGYFADRDSSGYAHVGIGDTGIEAYGNYTGGYFADLNSSGYAHVGIGDTGIRASGNTLGGRFADRDSSGYANVGIADTGIQAYGNYAGGYFADLNSSGYARVGVGGDGIMAFGNIMGGYFEDRDSSGIARVGYSTYKIQGNGTVAFVQNHPENDDQVIVYAAPEGDEVATYTRGSAKLANGEARIPLGETFKWVTNPDIGLTAHLTPVGGGTVLYVASKTTSELVVRSMPGFPDNVEFDYIVYGLRIGFEDTTVVQKKTQEARIPSMADHRKAIAEQPQLARYTALSRYARMQGNSREAVKASMNGAKELLEKIEEFDPAVHKIDIDRQNMEK